MRESLVLQQRFMSKQDHAQIYEMLSVLFLTCSKGEQVLQCIREVLTSHPLFSPLPLFLYISKNDTVIKRQHLLTFLEQNKQKATDEEIKQIIETVEQQKIWQYSNFLEFIYPFNSAVLREVTNLHLKRYPQLEKYPVPESAIAGFVILVTEHISLIRKLQVQKGDSLLKIPRERLKKVFLSIKKAGDRQPSHCENDDTRITSHELRNFMRAFVSLEDSHFLFLSRRLKIKKGSFPIEQLEKFIKPSKTYLKKGAVNRPENNSTKIKVQRFSQPKKQFNDKQYRQQLQQQLAKTLNLKQTLPKRPALHAVDANTATVHLSSKKQTNPRRLEEQSSHRAVINQNQLSQKPRTDLSKKVITPQDLLIKFIQIFLPTAKEMQTLKMRLARHKVDYLKLFKLIDRNQRGVASADDFYQYYISAGGKLNYSPQDFQMVIARFAQSDEPWLSFSEFCEMVRADDKEGLAQGPPLLGEQHQHIVLQILQLCIQSELTILKIRCEFRKHESKYLFNLINRQHNGFINYQQLKKFLTEAGLQLSMHDLMAVLKRLDRSRNGVVVEHEFVCYFQPPEGY